MNIAILARWISRNFTGVFEVSRRFAQSTADLGLDQVSVYGMRDEFTNTDQDLWHPLEIHSFASRGGVFGYASGMLEELKASKPDVVHVHGIWTYTGLVARRMEKPYMLSPHGMLDSWAVANSGWKKRIARWLYEEGVQRRAACMHAATEVELADMRRYGRSNPVCVIPYGVDIPDPALRAQAPWAELVPAGAKTILFMGRYHPKKGVLQLLQGWKIWRGNRERNRDEWHLILIGYAENGHDKELQAFVTAMQLGDTVHFVPPQFGDLRSAAYFNCDAFVLPSFSEGLPTAVLLAWAHAKPVLITNQCNLTKWINDGAGLLIEPEANSIAEGLQVISGMSSSERNVMGQMGLEVVMKHYVWSEVANQMREVYKWMCGGGSRPGCVDMR